MAARATWVLLWPTVLFLAFLDFLVWGLTCGDDGPADYGSASAGRYCDAVGHWDAELLLTAAPLLVLAAGLAWWDRPRSLRWVNVVAFLLLGAIAGALAVWATAYGVVVMGVLLWLPALVAAALVWSRSPAFAPPSDDTSRDGIARAVLALLLTAAFVGVAYAWFTLG